MIFWGFDLGDGESALALAKNDGWDTPKIMEIDGHKITLTVWALMPDGEVRIGEKAAKSAASALRSAARFKSRFLDPQADTNGLIRDFSAKILDFLRKEGYLLDSGKDSRFYIGCPAGWSEAARIRYQDIFLNIACPAPHVVSESRAVMVGAVQSNSLRDFADIRSRSVLVIDIGSSTTDFAYIQKGKESKIYTGGEVALGGGIMDELLLEICVELSDNSAELKKVFSESESWRVDCELRARKLKETYYSAGENDLTRERIHDTLMVAYDEPVMLNLEMNASISDQLINLPCPQLDGLSFSAAFQKALSEVKTVLKESLPELIFLTGGVSRMPEVKLWCQEVFPDAAIFTDREPEFSVARGLVWCGRIDEELRLFRLEIDDLIRSDTVENIVSLHLERLYRSVLDSLLDPLMEKAIKPSLLNWRNKEILRLSDLKEILPEQIKIYLYSEEAKKLLYVPVRDWIEHVSQDLEETTSSICRKYHLPEHALKITASLTPGDLSVLGRLDTTDVFAGQPLTGAAIFVESVISVLMGFLCGGSGIALISSGPVGIVAGIVISAVVLGLGTVLGRKSIDEKIMNADLPSLVRKLALAKPMPKLESAGSLISNPLELFAHQDEDSNISLSSIKLWNAADMPEDTADNSRRARRKFSLLPHFTTDNDDISDRRLKSIRQNIRTSYEKLIEDKNNEDLKSLNEKMCREISDQIEQILKELSEQVEIPL